EPHGALVVFGKRQFDLHLGCRQTVYRGSQTRPRSQPQGTRKCLPLHGATPVVDQLRHRHGARYLARARYKDELVGMAAPLLPGNSFLRPAIAVILASRFVRTCTTMAQPALILASSSVFRRHMLARLGLEFATQSPAIDESPATGEAAIDLVQRLAQGKAGRVAAAHPDALVIGADQVAEL